MLEVCSVNREFNTTHARAIWSRLQQAVFAPGRPKFNVRISIYLEGFQRCGQCLHLGIRCGNEEHSQVIWWWHAIPDWPCGCDGHSATTQKQQKRHDDVQSLSYKMRKWTTLWSDKAEAKATKIESQLQLPCVQYSFIIWEKTSGESQAQMLWGWTRHE